MIRSLGQPGLSVFEVVSFLTNREIFVLKMTIEEAEP